MQSVRRGKSVWLVNHLDRPETGLLAAFSIETIQHMRVKLINLRVTGTQTALFTFGFSVCMKCPEASFGCKSGEKKRKTTPLAAAAQGGGSSQVVVCSVDFPGRLRFGERRLHRQRYLMDNGSKSILYLQQRFLFRPCGIVFGFCFVFFFALWENVTT